jgi:hypothetical protein
MPAVPQTGDSQRLSGLLLSFSLFATLTHGVFRDKDAFFCFRPSPRLLHTFNQQGSALFRERDEKPPGGPSRRAAAIYVLPPSATLPRRSVEPL